MGAGKTIATSEDEPDAEAIRAALIDPADAETFTVSYVHIPTQRPRPLQEKSGRQLAAAPVAQLLGSKWVVAVPLWAGEWLLTAADGNGPRWWLGPLGEYRGRGIIVQWDRGADQVSDTLVELRDIGEMLDIGDDDETGDGRAQAA